MVKISPFSTCMDPESIPNQVEHMVQEDVLLICDHEDVLLICDIETESR